ncbi:glycosyltransferase [Lacrimispora sp. NSJ-141]|uniref:Glycosyltransferase n=1 Tax=Lientehia hominis TaxID=2897778 RepID=A0AAP2RHK2_9FIRM|nr:glycosyltransferase [Lientehia hominis]MCD2492287.1 glycosyltransferase [Lientehia hominis]
MKILMVNKFLYPNGGSETYMLKLGEFLNMKGHEVQYFGMEHRNRCVGNAVDVYTSDVNYRDGSIWKSFINPFKVIYSNEARKKMRLVLENFQPQVVHLNNFNYQLTPSILLEIKRYIKRSGENIKVIYTAHDYQLLCPNHMFYNPTLHCTCEKCIGEHYFNCVKGKCIHKSFVKSLVGMAEALFWKYKNAYRYIDTIICCSEFMKKMMDRNSNFKTKTLVMHNFIEVIHSANNDKNDYILYFGRFSEEKGIKTLVNVCRTLPDIPFVFAGSGDLEKEIEGVANIKNVGFKTGIELEQLISEARFSVYPSEWYENCPFSVMESQAYGTPVLGADIGGIPELIQAGKTGELFESGSQKDLRSKVLKLWNNKELMQEYALNCHDIVFDTIGQYAEKLMNIYEGKEERT